MEERPVADGSDSEGSGEGVTAWRSYSRSRLLALGRQPVCLLFPQPALQDPEAAAAVFPGLAAMAAPTVPPPKEVDWLEEAIGAVDGETLDEVLINFVKQVQTSEVENEEMKKLCVTLKEVFLEDFPDVQVEPYGSFASGLGFCGCDLDIFVSLGESAEDEEYNVKAHMWGDKVRTRRIASLLYQHGSERFRSAQPIVNAKTPIVRMKDRLSGVRCDLNMASRMGVLNSAFVKFCADTDPRARDLLMVVKCFGLRHSLTGSGRGDHLSSYSLVLLGIFFLQTRGLLHPLLTLQEVPNLQPTIIGTYNFAFCTEPALLPALPPDPASLSELLRDFFRYFAEFTFGSHVVCPLVGAPVLRYSLRQGIFLPTCLQDCATGRGKDRLKVETALIIQDPFELRRNVAGSVSPRRLRRLIRAFGAAARLLEGRGGSGEVIARLLRPDPAGHQEGPEGEDGDLQDLRVEGSMEGSPDREKCR